MKLSTAINKKNDAVRYSVDAVSAAQSFGQLSKDLHEKLRAIVIAMGKAPEWARSYVRGYQDCLTNGKFVSTFKQRADYYEKLGMGAKAWNDAATDKGIYWQEYVAHGVEIRGIRPYFVDASEDGVNRKIA